MPINVEFCLGLACIISAHVFDRGTGLAGIIPVADFLFHLFWFFVFSDMYLFLAGQCSTAFQAVITLSSPDYMPIPFDDSRLAGIPISNLVVQPVAPSVGLPFQEIPPFPTPLCDRLGILVALAASYGTGAAKPDETNSIFVSCSIDLNVLYIKMYLGITFSVSITVLCRYCLSNSCWFRL